MYVAEFVDAVVEAGRHLDVALADRTALGAVGFKQAWAAPAVHHRGELPAEINRIANSRVHPERAGGRELVHRIAGQQDPATRIAFGHDAAPVPDAHAQPFHVEVAAERAAQV